MGMNAGSVTSDGTGTGLAKEIFDIHVPKLPAQTGAEAKQGFADLCNSIAQAVVAHLANNAVASVIIHTTDGGLQRDPVSPNGDTLGPSTNKTLNGSIA